MQFSIAVILSTLAAATLAAPSPQWGGWGQRKGFPGGYPGGFPGGQGGVQQGHGNPGSSGSSGSGSQQHHGSNDHIVFSVTKSESEAVSQVIVPIGGGAVEVETAIAIAATEVIVEQVGYAVCTITTAEAEAIVTDAVVQNGWSHTIATTEADAKAISISCTYPSGH